MKPLRLKPRMPLLNLNRRNRWAEIHSSSENHTAPTPSQGRELIELRIYDSKKAAYAAFCFYHPITYFFLAYFKESSATAKMMMLPLMMYCQ